MLGAASSCRTFAREPVHAIHLIAEASRLAFADRNLYLGDPQFVDAPVAALLDARYLRARAALIDPDKAMATVAAGEPVPGAPLGTTRRAPRRSGRPRATSRSSTASATPSL